MVKIDIEFEYKPPRCSLCKLFDYVDTECHKKLKEVNRKMNVDAVLGSTKRKSKGGNKVKVPGKPKLIYRPVSKPSTNDQASTSIPKENSTSTIKEVVNLACDKLNDIVKLNSATKVTNEVTNEETPNDQSSNPLVNNVVNEFGYFKDDINLGELRSNMEIMREADKVFDLASNVVDVEDGSYLHIIKEISNSPITVALEEGMDTMKPCEVSTNYVSLVELPVSVLSEKEVGTSMPNSSFHSSTSATKRTNPFSKVGEIVDSDSEEEVLNTFDESANLFDMSMGTFSSSGGGGDQEDYYEYDDFTDQLYDLPGQLGAFYEDIKLQGRVRK